MKKPASLTPPTPKPRVTRELHDEESGPIKTTAPAVPETRTIYVLDPARNLASRQGPKLTFRPDVRAKGFLCNTISTAKYTVYGFPLKFLIEQFSNYANLFFLVTALLQQVPGVTPTNKFDTALPLIIVLLVTAFKEVLEDIRRHRSDDSVNNRITNVLRQENVNDGKPYDNIPSPVAPSTPPQRNVRNSSTLQTPPPDSPPAFENFSRRRSFVEITETTGSLVPYNQAVTFHRKMWRDVVVGDIVRIHKNEFFPADMILLAASDENGVCYVETSNLDGETNLKLRQTNMNSSPSEINYMGGVIQCELPNSSLYTFEANIMLANGNSISFGPKQLLLRGAKLRNTAWVSGIVVFTGHETKLMRNAHAAPIKTTEVHKTTNLQILALCAILLILASTCAIVTAFSATNDTSLYWYLPPRFTLTLPKSALAVTPAPELFRRVTAILSDLATFWVLYSNLVPISLIVTMESVKYLNSRQIAEDPQLVDPATGTNAVVRTSALVEELGQVQYVFSDKTGTLTCNVMEFKECCIGGTRYAQVGSVSSDRPPTIMLDSLEEEGESIYDAIASGVQNAPAAPGDSSAVAAAAANSSTMTAEAIAQGSTTPGECYSAATKISIPAPSQFDILHSDFSPSSGLSADNTSIESLASTYVDCPTSVQNLTNVPLASPSSINNAYSGSLNSVSATSLPVYDYECLRSKLSESSTARHDIQCREFMTLLSVCHSVVPERAEDGSTRYQASSPDEASLVSAAADIGYRFVARDPSTVAVEIASSPKDKSKKTITKRYKIHAMNEFNSTRKRMSVLVEVEDKYILYVKGADSVIFPLLSNDPKVNPVTVCSRCLSALDYYATQGLRTLTLGYRILNKATATNWIAKYNDALVSLTKRSEILDAVAAQIEQDLILVGVTAVEDKLQMGVPETIKTLSEANIKVWMLTGDRLETAVNIGFSCSLLTPQMKLHMISGEALEESPESSKNQIPILLQKLKALKAAAISDAIMTAIPTSPTSRRKSQKLEQEMPTTVNSENKHALIIDGAALQCVLDLPEFVDAACHACCVICCRVSPLQKALVVKAVRAHTNAITLSIGDGANDVSMIQAANIGIGITGLEGMQAARSADVAIGQFRFLRRILLVHGCYSYQRLTRIILYSFYKNTTLYLTQFWYAMFNAFSGQTQYEAWVLSGFNVAFTSFPPLVMGIFDRVLDEKALQLHPGIYRVHQSGRKFNVSVFWSWITNSVYHSIVAFFGVQLCLGGVPSLKFLYKDRNESGVQTELLSDGISSNGRAGGLWVVGGAMYSAVLLIVLLKIALATTLWVFPYTYLAIFGSAVLWLIIFPVYAAVSSIPGSPFHELGGAHHILNEPRFWMTLVIVGAAAILRDYLIKFWRGIRKPSDLRIEQARQRKLRKIAHMKRNEEEKQRVTDATNALGRVTGAEPKYTQPTRRYRSSFAFSQSSDQRDIAMQRSGTARET